MKKIIALILAATMLLSLTACGGESNTVSKEAFNNATEAFRLVTEAYQATNEYSQDIYEAWRLGVNSRKDYDEDAELDDFISEMHIDGTSIKEAIAKLSGKDAYASGDWKMLPYRYNGSYFSAWVSTISEAYVCSGDVDEIERKLTRAKDLMKELGEEYSDYEHYPNLKKYFTNTLAFLDFCQNPEGSFEQVVETFNAYRNNAREYFFDLNYVFGNSIGGMDDFLAGQTDAQDKTGESGESASADDAQTAEPTEAPAQEAG